MMTESSCKPIYQITGNGVLRLSDKAFIPDCEDNRDWQEYQQWLAEGNTPEPMLAPPPDLTIALNNGSARTSRLQKKQAASWQNKLKVLEQKISHL